MKKYLLLSLSILSIFFFNNRVEALTLNDGTEVNKDNYIYYVYQNYSSYFDDYDYFVASYDQDYNKWYNVFLMKCPYYYDNSYFYYSSTKCSVIDIYTKNLSTEFSIRDMGSYNNLKMGSYEYIIYSNYNIGTKKDKNDIVFNSNITKEDLVKGETKATYKITYYLNDEIYKEIEVEEGSSHTLLEYEYDSNLYVFSGWTVDDDKDLNNITDNISIHATLKEKESNIVYVKNFPEEQITKSEFYTLLILISTLIMLIFLRWCFPFRGGKDLK